MFTKDWFYREKGGLLTAESNAILPSSKVPQTVVCKDSFGQFLTEKQDTWWRKRMSKSVTVPLQWTVSPSESGDTPLPNPPHQVHSQASDLRLDSWAQAFWSAPSSNLFLYFCFICGVARTPNSFIHSFILSFLSGQRAPTRCWDYTNE